MKCKYQKSNLSEEEYRNAKRLAELINDIDNGIRVDPIEKSRLYNMPDKIRIIALEINRKRHKRRW